MIEAEIDDYERMGNIKEKFCEEYELPWSSVRFLHNGERVHDNDTAKSLGIISGDVIEVFLEMTGGGKQQKYAKGKRKNLSHNPTQILELLDMSTDESNQEIGDNLTLGGKTSEENQNNGKLVESDIHSTKLRKRELRERKTSESEECEEESDFPKGKPLKPLVREMFPQKPMDNEFEDLILIDEGKNIETPQKRAILFDKFQLKTPSPLQKLAKVTKEEMTIFSLAVHLYAEEKLGGKKGLQNVRLRDIHFQEILEFAGPGTMYNFIKGRSALQYKCLWRNSAKSKQDFRGHPISGFENESKVHDPSREFCPFQHCYQDMGNSFNPLEMDIRLITPERKENVQIDKKQYDSFSRKLFHGDKSRWQETTFGNHLETIQEEKEPVDLIEEVNVQSPTKENLLNKKRKLIDEMDIVETKLRKYDDKQKDTDKGYNSYKNLSLLKCQHDGCDKLFESMLGLIKHQKNQHANQNIPKNLEKCKICGKGVLYIDKHIRTVHKDELGEEICFVCMKKIKKLEMKNHRGQCIFCLICGKKEKKRLRLIDHIKKCKNMRKLNPVQKQPLDLSSPLKYDSDNISATQKLQSSYSTPGFSNPSESDSLLPSDNNPKPIPIIQIPSELKIPIHTSSDQQIPNLDHANKLKPIEVTNLRQQVSRSNNDGRIKTVTSDNYENASRPANEPQSKELVAALEILSKNKENLNSKRIKFPFDRIGEEEYHSEYEDTDSEEYTRVRRQNKDSLEIRLREADGIRNLAAEGDKEVVTQFRLFMQKTTCGENNDAVEPSTVGTYTRTIEKDLLKAFHDLFVPFDSRWLLDCTTEKECTFEGEAIVHVSRTEPIYLTARILRKALERYRSSEAGQQRATLIAATRQFMQFIELHFNNKLNLYGFDTLQKVMSYHNGVKSFIDSAKLWKACNKDKKRAIKNNKDLKEFENPNFEAEILENSQKYFKSKERRSQIGIILQYAGNEHLKPTDKIFTKIGNILMSEVVISSGCRPVVLYRLPRKAYTKKKPGFDTRHITSDDCVIDEEEENTKIYRRLNPNLPPKHLACKHQLEQRVAICPENCGDQCEPEGFNIQVYWDKTHPSAGFSYLHLAKPIKDLLDMYDIIKRRFFEGRKPSKYTDEKWLDSDNTPFFLQSSGNPFKSVDLQHVSKAMGIDVTSYSFRRIVSTWALSHASKEIRDAEGPTLQHSLRVGVEHYKQNNELQPQKLTQTYIQEESILPEKLREQIQKTEIKLRSEIAQTDSNRQKKQHESMIQESKAKKMILREKKPLGPKHRVLGEDRNEFTQLLEEITGINIEKTHKQWRPWPWRNLIIRTVCGTSGETGTRLRELWLRIYKGDLQWGVRDERLKAKENNWPRKDSNAYLQKRDRNSWIAFAILKSLQVLSKAREKENYVKIVNDC